MPDPTSAGLTMLKNATVPSLPDGLACHAAPGFVVHGINRELISTFYTEKDGKWRQDRRKRFSHRASSVQKEQRKRGKFQIYRDQQNGVRRESAKVGKRKGAKQVRSEDKKETARNKERKRCENLGREKATKRQKLTRYWYRHK